MAEKVLLSFYANTPKGENNKLFNWRIDPRKAKSRLRYWMEKPGWEILTAFLDGQQIYSQKTGITL